MNDKFMVIDATDEIVVGGFGNLEGNLGLLKYNKEDIRKMITENNNGNDNIRLINSLLQSLKELQEQLQQKEDIIYKIKKCIEEKEEYYGDYMGDGNYTMYSMMGANNNRIPYIKSNLIKQILDNKG